MTPTPQLSHKQQLQERRLALIARSEQQRQDLICQSAQIHHELRFVELGVRAGRALRAKPIYIAIAVAGLLIIKPKRALSLAQKGISAWRLWQQFSPLLSPFLAPLIQAWSSRSSSFAQSNNDSNSRD
jgi:hypothetical protein